MLILHGFGASSGLIDLSPFVLKVDCYLRMADIPYALESGFSHLKRSPKGKLPFITNEELTLADSSFILDYLKHEFGNVLDISLSPEQQAISHLVGKAIEDHLYWCLLYSRWVDESGWPAMKAASFSGLSFPFNCFVPELARYRVKKALYQQGIGRHSKAEIKHLLIVFLDSLNDLLGHQKFFFGDTPSSLDATAFAFLAQFVLVSIESDFNREVKTYVNLVEYCERVFHLYYRSFSHKVKPDSKGAV